MAKEEKAAKEQKAPATPEEEAAKGKKKKLIMFGAIGLLVVAGGAAGAFMFLGKGDKKPADDAHAAAGEHAEAEGDAAGDADGGHGKAEGGEKDAVEKTDAKKDEHAAAGEHGEAKKDEHAAAGEHGEAKKDEHGGGEHGAAAAPGKAEATEYQGNFGLIKEFKPFHLNLGNPLENRYVRLTLGVEYKGGEIQLLELNRREPQLRDAVVSIISRKTREHLLSPDGKDQVRLEIKNKLNQYLDKKIENVFITDILIE